MHDHDLDLVADLAEGTDPDGSARRLVESCADCAAEFSRQVAVRDLLHGLPPVSLTDDERRSLRAAVSQELDRGARVVAFPRRWAAIGSVAAGVLVLAGLGSVFGRLGGGDGADFDTIASALGGAQSATTAAAELDQGLTATEMAPAGALPSRSLDLGQVDLPTFAARLADQAASDERARSGTDTNQTTGAPTSSIVPAQASPCLDRVPDPGPTIVSAIVDGIPVVAFRPPGEAAFVAFRVSDCEPFPLE